MVRGIWSFLQGHAYTCPQHANYENNTGSWTITRRPLAMNPSPQLQHIVFPEICLQYCPVHVRDVVLTLGFSLSIVVAYFFALVPLMKQSFVISTLPSTMRSKIAHRDAHKLLNRQQGDIEQHGALPSWRPQHSHSSWEVPKGVEDSTSGGFDGEASRARDIRLSRRIGR